MSIDWARCLPNEQRPPICQLEPCHDGAHDYQSPEHRFSLLILAVLISVAGFGFLSIAQAVVVHEGLALLGGVRRARYRRVREGVGTQARYAPTTAGLAREAGAVPGGNGSVRLGASLGARDRAARPHGEADEPAVREALPQGQQERPQRCRGDLRGGNPWVDAVCANQEPAQQDIQALHRVREQLLKSRTALVNQVRGLLGEHGIVAPRGVAHLRRLLIELLAAPEVHGLSTLLSETLVEIAEPLRFSDQRVRRYDRRIERVFADDECCQRLAQVARVEPLVATAMVSAVGNAGEFRSGRELSAWRGLVPRQHSSGNRKVLLGISKRGDRYLRTLLIHGARSALCRVARGSDQCSL